MNPATAPLAQIRAINETAAFNQWCGIEVESAGPGKSTSSREPPLGTS